MSKVKNELLVPPMPSPDVRNKVMERHGLNYKQFWHKYRQQRNPNLVEEVVELMAEEKERHKRLNEEIKKLRRGT